jgi:hypothetical protein
MVDSNLKLKKKFVNNFKTFNLFELDDSYLSSLNFQFKPILSAGVHNKTNLFNNFFYKKSY